MSGQGAGTETVPLSFVVIAYDEERNLEHCLRAIEAQQGLGRHEVVVVDDGSRDATGELAHELARTYPAVRVLSQENLGRGAARARGQQAARGELVAMVDADVLLPPEWLARCLGELEGAEVVGGVPVPDGDVSYLHRRFRLDPLPSPTTMAVTGSNALFRREVFELAGFDPALRDGEDVALAHDLLRRGCRVRTVPGLLVEHREHRSFGGSLRWLYQSGRGASRQLLAYRKLRPPDLAYAGLLGTLLVAGLAGRRRRALWGLPAGYLAVVSLRHLQGKFALRRDPGYLARFALAIGADAVLLAGYFAGRSAGLLAAARHARGPR